MKTFIVSSLLLFSVAATACPTGTEILVENDQKFCLLKGKYLNSQLNLTANHVYRLDDEGVFIGGDNRDNSTIRIQAGTKILGEPKSFLAIQRGSKILAEGSSAKPIVFTSINAVNRKRGEWGGLVINGNAPINACKPGTQLCEAISEGIKIEPVKFGGNDPLDNSGVLKYVRVEFAGYPMSQDNELNGITFNAVGEGTEVDYIQVNMNADDGVEFFGGTVNVKHLVLTNNEDDSLDWDMGFTGKIQYLLVKQADDSADNGIEADNFKSPMNASPRSNPTISNATFLGGKNSAYGLLLRRGTSASFYNTILTGFTKACIDIDDAETFNHGGLKIESSIISCEKTAENENNDVWSTDSWLINQGNKTVSPDLIGYYPNEASPALGNGITPEDLFFDPVDYIGAFASAEDNWEAGWTSMVQE
ncbi:MAG: hypothetical protein NDI69_07210 [Bacteriovoracaceae bacterium]|nr:hypothetical protein [Bacteriovoracaceae bacterium]